MDLLQENIVCVSHIVVGLLVAYVAKAVLKKKTVNKKLLYVLLASGVALVLYHTHMIYSKMENERKLKMVAVAEEQLKNLANLK